MAYSNGYDRTEAQTALYKRLGWATDASLSTDNKASASGRYFDDGSFHSIVTVANVKATQPAGTSWDTFFERLQKSAIDRALAAVFPDPEYIEDIKFYDPEDEENDQLIANSGKAIGYRIELPSSYSKTVHIKALELYMDGAATFNVYLFKQGSKTAVKTKSVTTEANTKVRVPVTDWLLNYKDAKTWYVVYMQTDLGSVKAIQEQAEFNEALCMDFYPIGASVTTGTDFDRRSPGLPCLPYGLNIEAGSFNDHTRTITAQPYLFDNLVGLQMAYMTIEQMVYTVQSNATERILRDQLASIGIQLDLNGVAAISDSPQMQGLKHRIEKEATRIRSSFNAKPIGAVIQC